MGETTCKQYAFSVDYEERAVFNQAVQANGVSAIKEIRRMVEDFVRDKSRYDEIMQSSRKARAFPTKEVKINGQFDSVTLRRFTVICLYANVTASGILRGMITDYAKKYAPLPAGKEARVGSASQYAS